MPLGVPAAILLFAGASSPWVAQRMPRFFFPAVAAAGAVLALYGFGRAVAHACRQYRTEQRVRVAPLLIAGVAVIVITLLPLTWLLGVMTAPSGGAPRILVRFGDRLGGEGYPRPSPHRGIDVAGAVGADVLAAAEGRVVVARDNRDLYGLIVVIVAGLRARPPGAPERRGLQRIPSTAWSSRIR